MNDSTVRIYILSAIADHTYLSLFSHPKTPEMKAHAYLLVALILMRRLCSNSLPHFGQLVLRQSVSLEASVIGLAHAAYILSVVCTFYVDVWIFYLHVAYAI